MDHDMHDMTFDTIHSDDIGSADYRGFGGYTRTSGLRTGVDQIETDDDFDEEGLELPEPVFYTVMATIIFFVLMVFLNVHN